MSESHGVPETDAIEKVLRAVFWSEYHSDTRRAVEVSDLEYTLASEQLIALRARLEAAERENRWIPVSERLPEDDREVTVSTAHGVTRSGRYANGEWWTPGGVFTEIRDVLAWRELPAPYQPTGETTL